VSAARFLAFGCPHTIAVSAWLAEQAVGHRVKPRLPVAVQELRDRFAVPVEKMGRLLIIEDAWLAAAIPALEYRG
jgi:NifU-like protein involved in Fe-S cluster formation